VRSNKPKITAIEIIAPQQPSTSKVFHKPKKRKIVEIPQQGEKVSSGNKTNLFNY